MDAVEVADGDAGPAAFGKLFGSSDHFFLVCLPGGKSGVKAAFSGSSGEGPEKPFQLGVSAISFRRSDSAVRAGVFLRPAFGGSWPGTMPAASGAPASPASGGVILGRLLRVSGRLILLFLRFPFGTCGRPSAGTAGMALCAFCVAVFVRLGEEVHIERVMMKRVEEHGQEIHPFACAFIIELLAGQFPGHGHVAF